MVDSFGELRLCMKNCGFRGCTLVMFVDNCQDCLFISTINRLQFATGIENQPQMHVGNQVGELQSTGVC